jgi:DNA-binding PadR family transcriptional regulator
LTFTYTVVYLSIAALVASTVHIDTADPMTYLGEFEQIILFALLKLGDNAFGVSIRETIEERTGRTVSVGAIYTALARLEDRGMVASHKESPKGRVGRPRKFYALRAEGARALRDSYSTIQSMSGGLLPKLNDLAEA